jgi:8-oxo-dGTP pyrophosphatase MutT (NUDIX family)
MNEIQPAVSILIESPTQGGLYLGVTRKDRHDQWTLPGGKVDPEDKSSVAAALRELEEETGLVGDPDSVHKVFDGVCEAGSDGRAFYVDTFLVTQWSGEISTVESGLVGWVTRQQLLDGPFGGYNGRMFAHLDDRLARMMVEAPVKTVVFRNYPDQVVDVRDLNPSSPSPWFDAGKGRGWKQPKNRKRK